MKTEPTDTVREKAKQHANESQFLSDFSHDLDSEYSGYIAGFSEGQSSPNIKQLEWMVGEGTETILANIPFNNYYIIDGVDSMIFLTINIQYHIGRYATIDEAKAAAQAHFEKRVMGCLDIADNSNK